MTTRRGLVLPGIVLLVATGIAISAWRRSGLQVSIVDRSFSIDPETMAQSEDQDRESPPGDSPFLLTQMMPSQTSIDFIYYGSPGTAHHMTEQNGGGVAACDFDHDGRSDLFFVNGSRQLVPAQQAGESHKMYRGNGEFRFRDVTAPTGLTAFGFGQGCSVGDYDNDGFGDLFVAAYGPNRLWHNNGDGTFADVTDDSRVIDDRFGTSAAFADLDGDGDLDLYVTNYLDWRPSDEPSDQIPSPMDFRGQTDLLYQNDGDGRFTSIGSAAGIAIEDEGKGLALGIADLNEDHRLDVFVANDTTRNFLFLNSGEFKFEELGVRRGVAVSQDGSIGSSMGVALSDFDGDGRPDVFVTNFGEEVVDVFQNLGSAGFIAGNSELGIDTASRAMLNFGIVTADFDLDQWPDLFFANGHLWDSSSPGWQYRMPPTVMRNRNGKRFEELSRNAGEYFRHRWLGRAVATVDLDNDADTDLVVTHQLDPPAILRNDSIKTGQGIRIECIGTRASRQALGSAVSVTYSDQEKRVFLIPAGGSFQASHDPVIIVPTTANSTIVSVAICWSTGIIETFALSPGRQPRKDQTLRLIEGRGTIAGQ